MDTPPPSPYKELNTVLARDDEVTILDIKYEVLFAGDEIVILKKIPQPEILPEE